MQRTVKSVQIAYCVRARAIDELLVWLQPFFSVMPITYANQALREVMIKGQGLGSIWGPLLALVGFAVLTVVLAALTVRKEAA